MYVLEYFVYHLRPYGIATTKDDYSKVSLKTEEAHASNSMNRGSDTKQLPSSVIIQGKARVGEEKAALNADFRKALPETKEQSRDDHDNMIEQSEEKGDHLLLNNNHMEES